ncbi:S-adenosyl-L-methionine-dependent methyltransferase [Cristinia sonorae]|uniref:S-adenosyl-L-methionine-dependent methyltransferase n=1 Tax=Cristinia sonorae TaxID=1940300 RepID=A0A8K0XSC2_9AGAR|nr:S-adenosyl-L-methionine-dependent methyltransferase [Cristinia sonorae]
MATFGRASYDAARYASIRPTYPQELFRVVFDYHRANNPSPRWGTAVDLGCGTGQATRQCTPFERIIGVEPSAKMLEQARKVPRPAELKGTLDYVQSPAEELPFLEDSSVDLILSAQAAHWFDWNKLWREAARVLRPDGTLAVWGYSEFRLTNYPSATPLINEYSQGTDPKSSLGPYWERPGRSILDNHLLDIPRPQNVVPGQFHSFQHLFFRGKHHDHLPAEQSKPVLLQKTVTWEGLLDYFYTFSSFHTFQQQNPEDSKHPEGDIAVRFWKALQAHVSEESGGKIATSDEIQIEWPIALIMAKRS